MLPAAQSDSLLSFQTDIVQFRINDSLNLAEIYFAIPREKLTFQESDSGLIAEFELQVHVFRGEKELGKRVWQAVSYANDRSEITAGQSLFSFARFQMKSGTYNIRTVVRDLHSPAQGEQEQTISIVPFAGNALLLSDLLFASRVQRTQKKSMYFKNGFEVLPNPGGLYGDGMPLLMVYAEAYNLTYPTDSSYAVTYRVYNVSGDLVKALPVKVRPISGNNLVEVGGFNVVSLRSGRYILELTVQDRQTGAMAQRRKKFFVYRHRDQLASRAATGREMLLQATKFLYNEKTEKDLDQEFDAAKWLATKQEAAVFTSLDLEGKKEFLASFWLQRDSDSTTVRNEFREDYLARVQYAAENFGGMKPGWRTDRGRVLLTYGKPDEIERFPSNNNARAHEIWHYFNLEGGVQFIFVDVRGWGDYELVHSTARGELNDENWQRWLGPLR